MTVHTKRDSHVAVGVMAGGLVIVSFYDEPSAEYIDVIVNAEQLEELIKTSTEQLQWLKERTSNAKENKTQT